MTLGQKKINKINDTPAPGQYSPERADKHTMKKCKSSDFIRRIGRAPPKIDADHGPGTYETTKVFGAELGKVTMGSKCEFKMPQTPGPCDYSPERGDSLTMSSSKVTIFKASPSRPLLKSASEIGPGSYN